MLVILVSFHDPDRSYPELVSFSERLSHPRYLDLRRSLLPGEIECPKVVLSTLRSIVILRRSDMDGLLRASMSIGERSLASFEISLVLL